MAKRVETFGRSFYAGEKPPPTPFEVYKSDGSLDTSLSGKTLVAKCRNGTQTEQNVPCTNNGDGTGTIDWPTGTSVFVDEGTITVDINVTGGGLDYYLDRIEFPVRIR